MIIAQMGNLGAITLDYKKDSSTNCGSASLKPSTFLFKKGQTCRVYSLVSTTLPPIRHRVIKVQSSVSFVLTGRASVDVDFESRTFLGTTVHINVPDAIRDLDVHSVTVHGTINLCEGYVRWRLYFQLGMQSIEFNSQRRTVDGVTTLYIEHRNYKCSTKQPSIGQKDINLSRAFKVQEIVNVVLGNGRQIQVDPRRQRVSVLVPESHS